MMSGDSLIARCSRNGGADLNEYEKTLDALLTETKPKLEGLVLVTLYFVEDNFKDVMHNKIDVYGAVVKKLASKHSAILGDTQAAFDKI